MRNDPAWSRFAQRPLEILDSLAGGEDAERRAVAARKGKELVGLALFGAVAGAIGTMSLDCIVADRDETTSVLVRQVQQHAEEAGIRLLAAELPDTPDFAAYEKVLTAEGLTLEARVPDYYADGIALAIHTRRLGES